MAGDKAGGGARLPRPAQARRSIERRACVQCMLPRPKIKQNDESFCTWVFPVLYPEDTRIRQEAASVKGRGLRDVTCPRALWV